MRNASLCYKPPPSADKGAVPDCVALDAIAETIFLDLRGRPRLDASAPPASHLAAESLEALLGDTESRVLWHKLRDGVIAGHGGLVAADVEPFLAYLWMRTLMGYGAGAGASVDKQQICCQSVVTETVLSLIKKIAEPFRWEMSDADVLSEPASSDDMSGVEQGGESSSDADGSKSNEVEMLDQNTVLGAEASRSRRVAVANLSDGKVASTCIGTCLSHVTFGDLQRGVEAVLADNHTTVGLAAVVVRSSAFSTDPVWGFFIEEVLSGVEAMDDATRSSISVSTLFESQVRTGSITKIVDFTVLKPTSTGGGDGAVVTGAPGGTDFGFAFHLSSGFRNPVCAAASAEGSGEGSPAGMVYELHVTRLTCKPVKEPPRVGALLKQTGVQQFLAIGTFSDVFRHLAPQRAVAAVPGVGTHREQKEAATSTISGTSASSLSASGSDPGAVPFEERRLCPAAHREFAERAPIIIRHAETTTSLVLR